MSVYFLRHHNLLPLRNFIKINCRIFGEFFSYNKCTSSDELINMLDKSLNPTKSDIAKVMHYVGRKGLKLSTHHMSIILSQVLRHDGFTSMELSMLLFGLKNSKISHQSTLIALIKHISQDFRQRHHEFNDLNIGMSLCGLAKLTVNIDEVKQIYDVLKIKLGDERISWGGKAVAYALYGLPNLQGGHDVSFNKILELLNMQIRLSNVHQYTAEHFCMCFKAFIKLNCRDDFISNIILSITEKLSLSTQYFTAPQICSLIEGITHMVPNSELLTYIIKVINGKILQMKQSFRPSQITRMFQSFHTLDTKIPEVRLLLHLIYDKLPLLEVDISPANGSYFRISDIFRMINKFKHLRYEHEITKKWLSYCCLQLQIFNNKGFTIPQHDVSFSQEDLKCLYGLQNMTAMKFEVKNFYKFYETILNQSRHYAVMDQACVAQALYGMKITSIEHSTEARSILLAMAERIDMFGSYELNDLGGINDDITEECSPMPTLTGHAASTTTTKMDVMDATQIAFCFYGLQKCALNTYEAMVMFHCLYHQLERCTQLFTDRNLSMIGIGLFQLNDEREHIFTIPAIGERYIKVHESNKYQTQVSEPLKYFNDDGGTGSVSRVVTLSNMELIDKIIISLTKKIKQLNNSNSYNDNALGIDTLHRDNRSSSPSAAIRGTGTYMPNSAFSPHSISHIKSTNNYRIDAQTLSSICRGIQNTHNDDLKDKLLYEMYVNILSQYNQYKYSTGHHDSKRNIRNRVCQEPFAISSMYLKDILYSFHNMALNKENMKHRAGLIGILKVVSNSISESDSKEFHIQDIAQAMFGLKNMDGDIEEVDKLVQVLTLKASIIMSKPQQKLTSRHIGYIYSGLRYLSSRNKDTLPLFLKLILLSDTMLYPADVPNALGYFGNPKNCVVKFNTDKQSYHFERFEIHQLVLSICKKMKCNDDVLLLKNKHKHHSFNQNHNHTSISSTQHIFDYHNIAESLYYCSNLSNSIHEVDKLFDILSVKIKQSYEYNKNKNLHNGHQIGHSIFGLKESRADTQSVRSLLSSINLLLNDAVTANTSIRIYHLQHIIQGLQNMTFWCVEVKELLSLITALISQQIVIKKLTSKKAQELIQLLPISNNIYERENHGNMNSSVFINAARIHTKNLSQEEHDQWMALVNAIESKVTNKSLLEDQE